jgi:hypothetical protein
MAYSLPIDVAKEPEASLQDREIRQRGSCSQLSYRAPAARRPATQVSYVRIRLALRLNGPTATLLKF